jgi:hypothetical protein
MMKRATLAIADIYVPVKRRATLEQKRVDEIAATPILDQKSFAISPGERNFGSALDIVG